MSDEHTPNRTIGRYQILGELGRGAMGVVYRGFDPVIRRTVALKTMSFASDNAESAALRQRLYREAAAAGTLVHPNIVTVYDVVEDGATTAVAMELVEGQTLAALIGRSGPLPFDQAIWIFEQVCSALDFAGSKGIVHRDIKPANILLTAEGRPKIMDFGIARMALAGVTQTSTVMGSPSYMSPEQVRGLALDSRSDLFSAAVVFFEMLSGQRPFIGDDVATTMYRIVSGSPQAIERFVPSIQPAVARVIEWALSKERADRPQTGRALIDALKNAAGAAAGPATAYAPSHATVGAAVGGLGRTASQPEIATTGGARAPGRSRLLLAGVIASGLMFIGTVAAIVIMTSRRPGALPIGGGGAPPAVARVAESSVPGPVTESATAATDLAAEPAPRPPGTEVRGGSRRADPATAESRARSDAEGPRGAGTSTPLARPAADHLVPAGVPPAAAGSGTSASLPPATVVAAGSPAAASRAAAPPSAVEEPVTTGRAREPAAIAVSSGSAVVRIEFEGAPYPVTLFDGDARIGRVETDNALLPVEPGPLRLRAVNESLFLDTQLPPVTVRAGERRSIAVPGLCSAAFGIKGEDYTGVRLAIDGRQVPGPYPAQVPRIASGTHRVTYRWASGPAAGREVVGTVTLSSGGHFLVRAALDNDTIVVQQLR